MTVEWDPYQTMDETFQIPSKEGTITLQELSYTTGLSLEAVIARAQRCPTEDYITATNRSISTYSFEGSYYTIPEIALVFGVNSRDLFDKMVKQGFCAEEAVMVISKEEDARRFEKVRSEKGL